MAAKKRQKVDRSSTAAYAASQPLFDALRNATDSIAEQSAHLTKARDISQALHAKIVNGDHERHEEYMDSAVRAWKSATDAYCSIFEQLVSITAAEPSEGREAGKRHTEFNALFKSAKRAKEAVDKYEPTSTDDVDGGAEPETVNIKKEPDTAKVKKESKRTRVKQEPISEDEQVDEQPEQVNVKQEKVSDEDEEMLSESESANVKQEPAASDDEESPSEEEIIKVKKERVSDDEEAKTEPASFVNGSGKRPMVNSATELKPTPAINKSLLNDKIRYDKTGTKIIWENGELKVPHNSLTAEERKAWGIIQQRQRRKNRRGAHKSKAGQDEAGIKAEAEVKVEPRIEYEDVTAQVEERIKAKEEKKKAEKAAKKAEKKRKRESGDSFVTAAEDTAPAAEPAVKEEKPEKPAKKKSKKARETEAAAVKEEPEVKPEAEPEVKPTVNGDKVAKTVKKEKRKKEAEPEEETTKQTTSKKRKKVKGF